MTNLRPRSIIWFEWCFIAFVSLTLVSWAFYLRDILEYYTGSGQADLPYFLISLIIYFIAFSTQMLCWYFAARHAKVWAKWVFVVFWMLGLLIYILTNQGGSLIDIILSLSLHGLLTLCVVFLFLTDSRLWFRSSGTMLDNSSERFKDTFK